MKTFCCALCVPSAFIWTRLVLCLLIAIAFLCLPVAPLALCQRMRCPSFCARSFMPPGRLGLRWVPFAPMRFAVSPLLSLFTGTGLSPWFWSPALGAPVRCSPLFTCATFSMNTMAFARWARSWLRVRGSSSPHLFLTCSGGGGGAPSSLAPLPRVPGSCLCVWMWGLPIQLRCGSRGAPLVFITFSFYTFCFSLFVLRLSQP